MNRIYPLYTIALLSALVLVACGQAEDPTTPIQAVIQPGQVTSGGELEAVQTQAMAPPRVKRIWRYTIAFMAPDGTTVEAGTPVLGFETQELKTQLLDKKGELANKQSELEAARVNQVEVLEDKGLTFEELDMMSGKAKRKADLPEAVLAGNVYRENQLKFELANLELAHSKVDDALTREQLQTEEEILRTEVDKLQSEVTELEDAIKSMTLMANRSGIVIHKSDWNGNKFTVGDTTWGGRRVVEVADLDAIIARLEIPERDMTRVKVGQAVRFRLDANPDKQFSGTIESLSNVVRQRSKNQPARVIDAVVTVQNSDPEIMRPGMRVSAEIDTRSESST